MKWLILIGLLAALYGLHRLALWAESKGWIYYKNKRASGNALGTAALNVQQIIQPGTEHVLEVRQRERGEADDEGGPDKAGETKM